MEKDELKLEFVKFLKDNGVFNEYVSNLKNKEMRGVCSGVKHNALSNYLELTEPQEWIGGAFLFNKPGTKTVWNYVLKKWDAELERLTKPKEPVGEPHSLRDDAERYFAEFVGKSYYDEVKTKRDVAIFDFDDVIDFAIAYKERVKL